MNALLEKLNFEANITYSFSDNAVTAGIFIGSGINDVLEVVASSKEAAADELFSTFKDGGYEIY